MDVGTKKDGLVHIKGYRNISKHQLQIINTISKTSCLDVSRDYFVQDLNKLFKAGQDLDVWIKFIDVKGYKLGLQLFPVITQPDEGTYIHTVHVK